MCGEFHVSTTRKFDLIHDRLTEDREKSRKISDQYEFKLVMMRKNCVSWLIFLLFIFSFHITISSPQLIILRSIWNRIRWRISSFEFSAVKTASISKSLRLTSTFYCLLSVALQIFFDPAEVRNVFTVFTHEFYDYFGAFWLIAIWMKFLFSLVSHFLCDHSDSLHLIRCSLLFLFLCVSPSSPATRARFLDMDGESRTFPLHRNESTDIIIIKIC